MNTRIHISLPVRDLGAAVDFYTQLFGQPASKRRPDYANFRLDTPPIHLALAPSSSAGTGVPRNHSHFGIELPDAATFTDWRERLRDAGAKGRDQSDAVCCYAKADKLWLTDPDGNEWEIWVRKADAERMQDSHSGCCAAA